MDVNSAIKNEGAIIQHVFMLMLGNRAFLGVSDLRYQDKIDLKLTRKTHFSS